MNITCITVCVDYSDYLERALYWNTGHFDNHIVVTSKADHKTRALCSNRGIRCITTDVFYEDGAKFNKAKGINQVLKEVKPADWVLFLDADILLPEDFRAQLDQLNLSASKLYYTHRGTVPKKDMEQSLEELKLHPEHRNNFNILQPGIDTMPWGYFQLVNVKAPTLKDRGYDWMDTRYMSANEYDTEFISRWKSRDQSQLSQEKFRVLHLDHGPRGLNWGGRVSTPTTPSMPTVCDIHFVLPVTPSIPKYAVRLEDMKKYGIVNVGDYHVRITLLVEDTFTDNEVLQSGWPTNVEVNVFPTPSKNVEDKFAIYYLNVPRNIAKRTRWMSRIDDDSSTDVSALLYRLRNLKPVEERHHIIARKTTNNLRSHQKVMLERFGFTNRDIRSYQHCWEISVDSQAAMVAFLSSERTIAMYRYILGPGHQQDQQPWADVTFCYGMRLCGILPHHADFLSRDPNVGDFSYTGGHLAHIHYVAHDLNKQGNGGLVFRDNLWADHIKAVDEVRTASTQQ